MAELSYLSGLPELSTEELLKIGPYSDIWQERAHCNPVNNPDAKDVDFHPGPGGATDIAKAICEECVLIEPCREKAIQTPSETGVSGGTSGRERRRIRKERRLAAEATEVKKPKVRPKVAADKQNSRELGQVYILKLAYSGLRIGDTEALRRDAAADAANLGDDPTGYFK